MSEPEPGTQWGWEDFFIRNDWDAVDEWWRNWFLENPDDGQALGDLLAALRKKVPVIRVENGIERYDRHIRCDDEPSEWRREREPLKGAAKILEVGELEAAVEGIPESSLRKWQAQEALVRERLQPFLEAPEVTKGAEELSRWAHTLAAFERLASIGSTSRWMTNQMGSDHDAAWIREVIAEIALLAFDSGRHTQAAWGKDFEKLSVAREEQIRGFVENNEGRAIHNAKRTAAAAKWKAHACLVEAEYPSSSPKNSDRARHILKYWDKVETKGPRPPAPSQKTLQNWLSMQK